MSRRAGSADAGRSRRGRHRPGAPQLLGTAHDAHGGDAHVGFISWAKAAACAQRACPHDGGTRPVDAYSDREQCVLCDFVLPLTPLPEVDLDDAGSDLAWAVTFAQQQPPFPGALALVALSRAVRRGDPSWAMRVFGDDAGGLRRIGVTPRGYLAMNE